MATVDRIDVIQPALFATQVALARMWRSWGIEPSAVIGHSMGCFIAYWLGATTKDLLGGIVVGDAGPALGSADDEDARRLAPPGMVAQGLGVPGFAERLVGVRARVAAGRTPCEPLPEHYLYQVLWTSAVAP